MVRLLHLRDGIGPLLPGGLLSRLRRDDGHHPRLHHLRRGVRRAAPGGPRLRPLRGQNRAQDHARRHAAHHGHVHLPGRRAPRLRRDRHPGAHLTVVLLRVLQGIGLGGEWGGAVLMAVEHSDDGGRGLNGSWPQIGVPAGLVLGTGAFALINTVSGDAAWAWRVPFLLSVILIAVGFFVRLSIYESPAFSRVRESGTEARMPIIDVLRTYPRNVLLGMGSRIGIDAAFYILAVYSLTYISANLGLPESVGLTAVFIAVIMFPIGGATLISLYIAILCALSVLCYFLADETFRKDIYEEEPEERR